MRDDRVLLLGWCVVLALLVAHTQSQSPPEPSWKCRVCEDAVQTWHDRFKCAGSSLSMEMQDPNSPEAGSKSMQACRQPTLDCNDLNEHLKPICKAMRYQFITRKQGEIWTMLMNKGNVYDTCIRMGKCINDTEQPDAHDCRLSFKNASCHSHLTCAPVEQHCSSRCFLCYHLVRDWPLFQQTCKPPGATIEQEAHPDEEKVLLSNGAKPSASFLQSSSAVAMGRAFSKNSYRKMLARQRARKQADEIDRLAGPFGAPVTPKDDRADYFDENFSFLQLSAAPYNPYNDRDDADAVAELKRRAQSAPVRAAVPAGPGRGRGQAHRGRPSQKIPVMTETEAWTAAISQADGEADAEATDENPVVPVQNSDTLPMQCHEMWDTIRYSKKCRYFVQFKTDVSILPGPKDLMAKQGPWDANIACKCLGYCELSKFENLGLADVCKFGQEEQQTMDILLAEYIREAPHKGISNEKEDEEEGDDE